MKRTGITGRTLDHMIAEGVGKFYWDKFFQGLFFEHLMKYHYEWLIILFIYFTHSRKLRLA